MAGPECFLHRFSVVAASHRAASAAKAGVDPFPHNWSTSSKSAMSVRRVASVRKSSARFCSRERVEKLHQKELGTSRRSESDARRTVP